MQCWIGGPRITRLIIIRQWRRKKKEEISIGTTVSTNIIKPNDMTNAGSICILYNIRKIEILLLLLLLLLLLSKEFCIIFSLQRSYSIHPLIILSRWGDSRCITDVRSSNLCHIIQQPYILYSIDIPLYEKKGVVCQLLNKS